jgi:hypothetical protein
MRYGFVLPGGTATEQLTQAVIADQTGWDGVFVWEAACGVEGEAPATDRDEARRVTVPFAEAGATWWLESRWELPHHSAERMCQVRERLAAGPPR